MKKKAPHSADYKAGYARGYSRGRIKERHSQDTVIAALNRQVAYWREEYDRLRGRHPDIDAEFHIVSINQGADGWEARYRDDRERGDEAQEAFTALCRKQMNVEIANNPELMKMLGLADPPSLADPAKE